jgi:hypothetical protein
MNKEKVTYSRPWKSPYLDKFTLEIELIYSYETSADFYETTLLHTSEDSILDSKFCDNLKFFIVVILDLRFSQQWSWIGV